MTLILASASPRRRDLLALLDLQFTVIPSDIEEGPPRAAEDPRGYALRLAREKARMVAAMRPDDVVLAADTVVTLDGAILGKPRNPEHAVEMLMFLSGRTHAVVTAVAARCGATERAGAVRAEVRMRTFSPGEAERYVASGEPMDKAGAYAVQGLGGALVDEVCGCYHTVVGLPLCLTRDLLHACGIVPGQRSTPCAHHGPPCAPSESS